MLLETRIFLVLFLLHCSPVSLIPIPQSTDVVTNNANNSEVLGTNEVEQITTDSSKTSELIQQIDVKDVKNQVISNINNVNINDELNDKINKEKYDTTGTLNTGTNDEIVPIENTTGVLKLEPKFRTGEPHNQENNENKEYDRNNENNSDLKSYAPDNATVVGNSVRDDDILGAETPVFRTFISNKRKKPQQESTNEPKPTKDSNVILKLAPESLALPFDLNQIPINNILGGALSFIKRLKRNSKTDDWKSDCELKNGDEDRNKKYCAQSKTNNDDLAASETEDIIKLPTRKSSDDLSYDSVELECPLPIIVKLFMHQVLDKLTKNNSDNIFGQILSSLLKGNENAINLASKELSFLPIPVKLRLQLVHGNTKEFMEQLSEIVDATLCAFS